MSGLSAHDPNNEGSPDTVTSPDAPLDERLFPQLSLRFFLALIAFSAVVLWTLRAALVDGQFWAKCVAVVLATIGGCFIVYAVFFLLALLLATISFPMIREVIPEREVVSSRSSTDPPEASSR
ncbi:MAG: hypothetical protein WD119_02565 [Pirellulaceae bacterium]